MNRVGGRNLKEGLKALRKILFDDGYELKSKNWQAKENPPEFIEILHADMIVPMASSFKEASELLSATQPWADIHFNERVSGIPYNPPPSHLMWLTGTNNYFKDGEEKFSHTYPERMWCDNQISGIRFKWGNLQTAIELLKKDPETRQCYIPIWFPEDLTAALEGERVPCTFGWHFLIRGGEMHCSYHMRSCDAIRHIHNDLYFANRLTIWLIENAKLNLKPGLLHFSSTSFHCFKNDRYALQKMI